MRGGEFFHTTWDIIKAALIAVMEWCVAAFRWAMRQA